MKYIAKEQEILSWLSNMAKDYAFFAPRKIGKSISYQVYTDKEIESAKLLDLLDYTTSSPKNALIPQAEVLFSYKSTKNSEDFSKVDTVLDAQIENKPSIVFGARPCDIKGFEILDMAYLKGKYQDPYYKAKRENTLVIAQACTVSLPTCFCNWTEVDMCDANADIMLIPVENAYIIEVKSDKAKEALKNATFKKADDKEEKEVKEIQDKARKSQDDVPNLANLPKLVLENFENTSYWAKMTSGCIGCSSCTFVCPTCQCFTINDEGNPLEGKRIRSWSSCMGEEFTREASGHNPRAFGFTRWRNRLSHKFSYMYSWHKSHSCTGCGRCLISCPSSISIKGMLDALLALEVTDKKSKSKSSKKSKEGVE